MRFRVSLFGIPMGALLGFVLARGGISTACGTRGTDFVCGLVVTDVR